MGGVPAQLVPDNPKAGVDRGNWYEPGLNRTYLELATYYRTAILPMRPRKPRDKAKVNTRPMRRLGVSRRDLFLELDSIPLISRARPRVGWATQPIRRFAFTFTPTHGSWLKSSKASSPNWLRSVLRHPRQLEKTNSSNG